MRDFDRIVVEMLALGTLHSSAMSLYWLKDQIARLGITLEMTELSEAMNAFVQQGIVDAFEFDGCKTGYRITECGRAESASRIESLSRLAQVHAIARRMKKSKKHHEPREDSTSASHADVSDP